MLASEIAELNGELEKANAVQIIEWSLRRFGSRIALTSSFQTQSLPLLHIVSRVCPNLAVFFLDTGFHFPETIEYRAELVRRLGINVRSLVPQGGHQAFLERHGRLYATDPNMCCYLNKVRPLEDALRGYEAWISGIRRDQTPHRAKAPILSIQDNGLVKICPMVHWTAADVKTYIARFELPSHPLLARGYHSIGCAPCTRPVSAGQDYRSGRWSGTEKTECGLHLSSNKKPPFAAPTDKT